MARVRAAGFVDGRVVRDVVLDDGVEWVYRARPERWRCASAAVTRLRAGSSNHGTTGGQRGVETEVDFRSLDEARAFVLAWARRFRRGSADEVERAAARLYATTPRDEVSEVPGPAGVDRKGGE